VITRFPADPLADTARYELAQRALGAGDRETAARHLDRIVAQGREAALVEGARFLRCRVAAEEGAGAEARRCLEAFRSSYPLSPRDPDALAALIQLARQREDCAEVKRLAAEYRRRYPRGPFSALAARSEETCGAR
jgi:outer membrane protein assembly factor BamD (BamD/ComL family)